MLAKLIRVLRTLFASSTCCGCGAQHRVRNQNGTFSAFCTDTCLHETMKDIVPWE